MVSLTSVDTSWNKFEGPLPSTEAFHEVPGSNLTNNKALCRNASDWHIFPKETKIVRFISYFLFQ